MSVGVKGFRLGTLPLTARAVATCFVLLAGVGYLVSVVYLVFTYRPGDGSIMVKPADVERKLAGDRTHTLIESKLGPGGSMAGFLTDSEARATLLGWVHRGAKGSGFAAVAPIFNQHCIKCHNENGAASFRPFAVSSSGPASFQNVSEVAKPDLGESPEAWARIAHIHLQSISMILLGLGLLYAFCGAPEKFKTFIVVLSFLSLFGDFGSRALVPDYPWLVYIVMGSGATMAFSMAVMILSVLYEVWIAKPGPSEGPVTTAAAAPAPPLRKLKAKPSRG